MSRTINQPVSQPNSAFRWPGRHALLASVVAVCAAAAGVATAQAPQEVVVVKAGDTFSGIAARFTGSVGSWRQLYRPELSNLADPNRIFVGMRIESVTDASGQPYLRVVAPAQAGRQVAQARPQTPRIASARAAAPATLPVPAAPPSGATSSGARADASVAATTLVIGVLPNIPAPVLHAQYERMKRYLERTGTHSVRIVVPRNFKEFFDSTMRGDYDLAIAAPHFARVAQVDRQMIPLLTYQPQIHGLFIAPGQSSIKGAGDARERVVAFANPQSLVAMYGHLWLKRAGLEQGSDYEMRAARTDLGVGRMLLTGDAVAAVMSNGEFRALPPDELARLKVVEIFARIPNFIFMAHPRIDSARLAQIKTQLQGYFSDAEEGLPFAEATGFTGLVDIEADTMRELDAFTAATRRAMGVGQ